MEDEDKRPRVRSSEAKKKRNEVRENQTLGDGGLVLKLLTPAPPPKPADHFYELHDFRGGNALTFG